MKIVSCVSSGDNKFFLENYTFFIAGVGTV